MNSVKKLEMDITPLDEVIADFEEALRAIDCNELSEYDDMFEELDFSILDSNEDIRQELTGLSTLMEDLQHLLEKELDKVNAVQREYAAELVEPQMRRARAVIENDRASADTMPTDEIEAVEHLSRKDYRKEDKRRAKRNQNKRTRR